MVRKISSAIDGPLVLTERDDPLIVTRTGTITSTGTDDGVDGAASAAWTITNGGTISSAGGWGINLTGAGVVRNQGTISGLGGVKLGAGGVVTNTDAGLIVSGIDISGDLGTVTNKGAIHTTTARAVSLTDGGTLTNIGSIDGIFDGVVIDGGSGTLTNSGTIHVYYGEGVLLRGGGMVTNKEGGSISGIRVSGGSGTVTNKGMIRGTLFRDAVGLSAGGSVTNSAGGSISGIGISGGSGTVTNKGAIRGVYLFDGGSVANERGGSITAGAAPSTAVWMFSGPGTVTNAGTIRGYTGVHLGAGGSVANSQGGSISGGHIGIEILGTGTVMNAGTISGGKQSVLFGAGSMNNLLVIKPSAVFNGPADATAATDSTIELAKGVGVIAGIGTGQFIGFDTLQVDGGAKWTLNGSNTIGTLLNDGRLEVAGGLTVSDSVDPHSSGVFQLAGASTLEVAAALGTDSKISFAGSELIIDHFGLFGENVGTSNYTGSLLEGFGGGSTIDIKDFGIAGLQESFSASSGLLQLTNATSQMATLGFQTSSLGAGTFHFASDGSNGILITHW